MAQSSRRQISCSIRSSEGAIVGSPTQAEPLPSAVRPTRFTAPVGWAWESRSPVELPRYSVARSCSAKPASTASRARARPKAPESADEHVLERARVGLLGFEPEVDVPAGSPPAPPGRRHRRPGAPPAHRPARRPPSPPHRLRRPRRCAGRSRPRRPDRAMTLTERPRWTPLVVVVFRAKRTSTWLLSSTSTMQPSAPSVSADGQSRARRAPGRESPTRSPASARTAHRAPALQRPDSSRVLSTPHPAHEHRRAAVRDRGHLAGLALAAVEGPAEHPGGRAAHGLHGAPEVGRGGLVRDVLQLPGQLPPSIR